MYSENGCLIQWAAIPEELRHDAKGLDFFFSFFLVRVSLSSLNFGLLRSVFLFFSLSFDFLSFSPILSLDSSLSLSLSLRPLGSPSNLLVFRPVDLSPSLSLSFLNFLFFAHYPIDPTSPFSPVDRLCICLSSLPPIQNPINCCEITNSPCLPDGETPAVSPLESIMFRRRRSSSHHHQVRRELGALPWTPIVAEHTDIPFNSHCLPLPLNPLNPLPAMPSLNPDPPRRASPPRPPRQPYGT